MDIDSYTKQTKSELALILNQYLKKWQKQINSQVPQINKPVDYFFQSVFGGKMIRGTLVKLGYQMIAHKILPEILQAAAAFEILHTSLLIHDDVIDRSILRRNKPTMFEYLGASHYAISQSIC